MCLGAIYWARPDKVFFSCTKEDAANAGFDDDFIYREIELAFNERSIVFEQLMRDEAQLGFIKWKEKEDKKAY